MSRKEFLFPEELFYEKNSHMWIKKEDDDIIVTGIDAIGLDNLGDLAYITLRPAGTHVKKGESMGTLEAAKMTGDVFAPVSGTVVAVNEACVQNPGIVNDDTYGRGWLISIKADDWPGESVDFVSGEALKPWVEAEIKRLESQGFDA